jgi:hypothetical protein
MVDYETDTQYGRQKKHWYVENKVYQEAMFTLDLVDEYHVAADCTHNKDNVRLSMYKVEYPGQKINWKTKRIAAENAFAFGTPSVNAEFENLAPGWYALEVLSFSKMDFNYNLHTYSAV